MKAQSILGPTGLSLMLIVSTLAAEQPGDRFQANALLHPSPQQLAAELEGRIYIYDGLPDATVETALDRHPERIQNMMFVRTRKTAPDGDVYVPDDGCGD